VEQGIGGDNNLQVLPAGITYSTIFKTTHIYLRTAGLSLESDEGVNVILPSCKRLPNYPDPDILPIMVLFVLIPKRKSYQTRELLDFATSMGQRHYSPLGTIGNVPGHPYTLTSLAACLEVNRRFLSQASSSNFPLYNAQPQRVPALDFLCLVPNVNYTATVTLLPKAHATARVWGDANCTVRRHPQNFSIRI